MLIALLNKSRSYWFFFAFVVSNINVNINQTGIMYTFATKIGLLCGKAQLGQRYETDGVPSVLY
jgi:hypothetical protein